MSDWADDEDRWRSQNDPDYPGYRELHEVKSERAAALAERVDEALHEWWDDKQDGSSHGCRPVPSEDAFLAIAERLGLSIALKNAPERAALTTEGHPTLEAKIAAVLHEAHGGGPWDDDVTGGCACDDRARRLLRAEETNAEHEALRDLQWTRMQEAIEHWQMAHPGNDHVWPDLGKLLTWLLEDRKHLLRIASAARAISRDVAARDTALRAERGEV
jgi:hypothetical protein